MSKNFSLLTSIQAPLAGMSTTTGLGIRYGDGKHSQSAKSAEDLAKVCSPCLVSCVHTDETL